MKLGWDFFSHQTFTEPLLDISCCSRCRVQKGATGKSLPLWSSGPHVRMLRKRRSQFATGCGREQGGHRKWARVDGHNATILLQAVQPSREFLEHRPEGSKGATGMAILEEAIQEGE